jgi:hypothetical protein
MCRFTTLSHGSGDRSTFITDILRTTCRPSVWMMKLRSRGSKRPEDSWSRTFESVTQQLRQVDKGFCGLPGGVKRIVVTHHPLDLPQAYEANFMVGRHAEAMSRLLRGGLGLLLAGYLRVSSCGPTAAVLGSGSRLAVLAEAGTARSTPGSGEAYSYNAIRLDESIAIQTLSAGIRGFEPASIQRFDRSANGQIPAVQGGADQW